MTGSATEPVRVVAFPGAPNLPVFAALERGFFARRGVDVSLELTPSSVAQAERAAAGEFDLAMTAFDNVVAYAEGQGAAGPGVDPGYVVAMGATQLELSLVVAPEVETYGDLRGRSLALDALATGFAFVLHEMLARNGVEAGAVELAAVGATPQRWQAVKAGAHAGTLTIEPFTSLARRAGFRVLDSSSSLFEAYQGGVVAPRRAFAAERPQALRGYLHGYLDGLDWALDPANRAAGGELLLARMDALRPEAVDAVMDSLLSPRSGLTPEGAVIPAGMRTVLELRARYGRGPAPGDPERYLDLSHREAVLRERGAG